jgi:hypothetical protein
MGEIVPERPLSHRLLDLLESPLAERGWRRSGPKPRSSFTRRVADGEAQIHIQRSWMSEKDLLRVTANLSASLDVLDEIGGWGWGSRIGHFMSSHADHWWELRRAHFEDDARPLIETVLDVGVHEALRHSSTKNMLGIWATGRSYPTEDEFYRFIGLAVLLRQAGRTRESDEYLEHADARAKSGTVPEWSATIDRVRERFARSGQT